jgi:type I restriction enzyme S subunit
MTIRNTRIGDVLELERLPIAIDPLATYTAIGIRSFGKGIFNYEPTLGSELSKLRYFKLTAGRLVLSNIKAWEGAIALSAEAHASCIASNRFLSYVADPAAADANYLRYFFLSEDGLPLIQRASPGSADRNRTLAIDRFEALEIPLPDVGEQRKIAIILDADLARVQTLIEMQELQGRRLRALGASLLNRAFAGLL